MTKHKRGILASLILLGCISTQLKANEPDSAYVFSYATQKNMGKNGLHFAWSIDRENWQPIGPEHAFVKSDFGSWGSQKRMIDPVLTRCEDGTCLVSGLLMKKIPFFLLQFLKIYSTGNLRHILIFMNPGIVVELKTRSMQEPVFSITAG